MSLTVTATQSGSTHNGMLLRVFVITGALPNGSQSGNGVSHQFAATATWTQSITNSAGSSIYGAAKLGTNTPTVTGSNATIVDDVADATNTAKYETFHATNLSAGTTTRGFTLSATASGPFAMFEILASGTLAEDGSAPAVVSTTSATSVTTASFTPPGGALLVALVAADGGGAVETISITDSAGLSWSNQATSNPSGGSNAGVWTADGPAATISGTLQPWPTIPVPRRILARSRVQSITGQGFVAVAAPRQQPRPAPRRIPARAYVQFTPVKTTNAPPVGPPPVIPTSGGDRDVAIRVFRSIQPGDVPATGAARPTVTGRAFAVPIPSDTEHTGHAWELETPPVPPVPGMLDAIGHAAAAAYAASGRAVELGRIFADPPYDPRKPAKCGATRTIGGVVLTCRKRPGHRGKHSDRGLDWG